MRRPAHRETPGRGGYRALLPPMRGVSLPHVQRGGQHDRHQ